MSALDEGRLVERLGRLVTRETPSGDAARLDRAYELISVWGEEAFGRPPSRVEREGVPHLVWEAEGDPAVLLLCHADTVFPAGTIERRPFSVDGDKATGPGVFDMKAGIVIGLAALETVVDTSRVAMIVTGDEETGSITSRALIEEVAGRAGAVLVLEPSLDGALKVGRKGGSFYDLRFEGLAAHAGLEPESGRNALLAMARSALGLPGLADHSAGTTVTPSMASAGTAVNVVPDAAVLTVDVRGTTLAELERVDAAIHALAGPDQEELFGVSVTVVGGINRPPLEVAGSVGLVELCREQARRLGIAEPDAVTVGGASDGNFTAALGVPTLDGLGPAGGGAHAEHEWVRVSAMPDQAALVAGMVEALVARA